MKNPAQLEIALIALAVADNALEDLSKVKPGPCTCTAKHQYDGWHCEACQLSDLVADANGMTFTVAMFASALDSQQCGLPKSVSKLQQFFRRNNPVWEPEHVAAVLLRLAGDDDDEEEEEVDEPVIAGGAAAFR